MIGGAAECTQSSSSVTFLWSPRRLVVAAFMISLSAAVLVNAIMIVIFSIIARHVPAAAPIVLVQCLLYPMFFAGFSFLFARRRPPWLRTSEAGLEVAASRADPIFLPWPAIASVRFRWRGPLTFLEIMPTDPALALRVHRGGRSPSQRRRGGRVTFIADIGSLAPNPTAVRAALLRHGCRLQN